MNLENLKLKEPFVIILVGAPLSGKTTFIREKFTDVNTISRDEILMEVYGSRNYSEAFQKVNQKRVDQVLDSRLKEANISKQNVIIDMTHMSSKRRKKNLEYFSDAFYKLCIIFPILSDDEYKRRNSKRIEEENKDLPMHVIKNMISSYQPIKNDEGFDKVIMI